VDVADTGIGIAPQSQSRIFDEFSQEDASTTRRFGGTGLGLSIVRQLVDLMGGTLSLASAPGAGSTFSFDLTLPLVDPQGQMPESPLELRAMRVLVAEGNASVRALMERALSSWGADAVCVATLPEAIKELNAAAFNTVLIDDSSSQQDTSK